MVPQYGKNPMYYPDLVTVVSDLHSQCSGLMSLLSQVALCEGDHLVFSGDLLDSHLEGSDPLGILNLIRETKERHKNTFIIQGNHEEMFLSWLATGKYGTFQYAGGLRTVTQLCEQLNIQHETLFDPDLN